LYKKIDISIECFAELVGEDENLKSIELEIILDEQYPFVAPVVFCKTRVFFTY